MGILTRLLGDRELKAIYGVLDEADITLNNDSFQLVRSIIELNIKDYPKQLSGIIKKGTPPRQWVYAAISNVAGDLLESGKYHLHRGLLNPIGPGKNLLSIYDSALNELVAMGSMESKAAEIEKKALRKNIKDVG